MAVAALAATSCGGAENSPAGLGNREGSCDPGEVPVVAFDRNPAGYGPGGAEVVVRQPDGTSDVVTGVAVASRPDLSPDGADVVVVLADGDYESSGPGATSLSVVPSSGGELLALTERTIGQTRDEEPAWSPDGAAVAASVFDGSQAPTRQRLALVSVDGGESTYLTSGEDGDDAAPTWSPDGRRLAFVRRTPPMHAAGSADQRAAVWVIDADGTGAREVAPLPANLSGVATVDWHPSEPWLLVSTFSEDEARAGVVDTETGRVSDVTGAATFARWTPSGDVVHYTTEGASQQSWWRLVLSRYDAGELVEIEDLGHEDYLYPYFGLSVGPCR